MPEASDTLDSARVATDELRTMEDQSNEIGKSNETSRRRRRVVTGLSRPMEILENTDVMFPMTMWRMAAETRVRSPFEAGTFSVDFYCTVCDETPGDGQWEPRQCRQDPRSLGQQYHWVAYS